MKKGLALVGVWMLLCLAGCTSDPREPSITRTLDLLQQTTAKVAALTSAIDSAITKASPEHGIVLKGANAACEQLKTLCQKQLQPAALEIQQLQRTTSDEQKQELNRKFRSQIESDVTSLNEKYLALHNKIAELKKLSEDAAYAGSKEAVNTFITRTFAETLGEFNSLNRQLK